MKRIRLIALCLFAGGCVSPNLGEVFDTATHARSSAADGLVIIFADAEIAEGIIYQTWANGDVQGIVFPNSFRRVTVPPGEAAIGFREQFGGNPIKDDLPPSFTYLGSPLSFWPPFVLRIDVAAGEVRYIQIRKEREERFVECEETRETIRLCSRVTYRTIIEPVDETAALVALRGMQESVQ